MSSTAVKSPKRFVRCSANNHPFVIHRFFINAMKQSSISGRTACISASLSDFVCQIIVELIFRYLHSLRRRDEIHRKDSYRFDWDTFSAPLVTEACFCPLTATMLFSKFVNDAIRCIYGQHAPDCNNATRSHNAASSIYGVETSMVIPCCFNRLKHFPKLFSGNSIDTGGGFIKEQNRRTMYQCAAQRQLLFHAAG